MKTPSTLLAPDTVRLERLLPGPVERVWAYLTESDKRAQWLAAGRMDLRVGGKVQLEFDNSKLPNEQPLQGIGLRPAVRSALPGRARLRCRSGR